MTTVTLLLLTGLFERLPEATLGAIVIVAVAELIDFPALRRLYLIWTSRLALSIHGDLAGRVSERRKVLLTWENEGVEANILP